MIVTSSIVTIGIIMIHMRIIKTYHIDLATFLKKVISYRVNHKLSRRIWVTETTAAEICNDLLLTDKDI